MSRYPLPAEEELTGLIRDAMEFAPGPDMRRLQQLEGRLARTAHRQTTPHRPNTLPWWAVLLLLGGFAAAAWWAGDRYWQEFGPIEPVLPPAEINPAAPSGGEMEPGRTPAGQADEAGEAPESPIIYQRQP